MLKYSTYQSIHNKPSLGNSKLSGLQAISVRKGLTRIMTVIILLTITCTGMVSAFAASDEGNSFAKLETVVVKSGDTLWEIAVAHKPKGKDTRVYIEHIKDYNELTVSSIQSGDVLILPPK